MKIKLFILAIIISMSCNKTSPIVNNENLKQINEYKIYGDVHNELLSYANDNFTQTKASFTTLDDGIEYLSLLQKKCVDNMHIDEISRKQLKEGLETYKDWYVTDNMYITSFTKTNNGKNEIESNFDFLLENKLIDVFEYNGLKKLSQATEANYKGELSVSDFLNIVNELIEDWEKQGYTKNSEYGEMLAISLSISQASLTWWTENPDALQIETKAIPAFVGADIAGALISSASTLTYQIIDSGEVNWKGIGWSAASGAIVGSTGVVGKIGNWITKMFK